MFKKLLSLTLVLSFLLVTTITTPAYASEADDQYYPITEEMAYTFAEMSEVASNSYDKIGR